MEKNTFDNLMENFSSRQKPLLYGLGILVAIIGLGFYITQIYLPEQETEAQEAMFMAEINFQKKNFELALNGEGKHKGFNYIKDNYSFTKSKKLAGLYAGLCNFNLGKFDKAIEDLKGYTSDVEEVQTVVYSALGDCYAEKNNMGEAVSYYEKAAKSTKNAGLAPRLIMKAGKAYESKKDNAKALEMYKYLKTEFPNSQESQLAEIFITKLESVI